MTFSSFDPLHRNHGIAQFREILQSSWPPLLRTQRYQCVSLISRPILALPLIDGVDDPVPQSSLKTFIETLRVIPGMPSVVDCPEIVYKFDINRRRLARYNDSIKERLYAGEDFLLHCAPYHPPRTERHPAPRDYFIFYRDWDNEEQVENPADITIYQDYQDPKVRRGSILFARLGRRNEEYVLVDEQHERENGTLSALHRHIQAGLLAGTQTERAIHYAKGCDACVDMDPDDDDLLDQLDPLIKPGEDRFYLN